MFLSEHLEKAIALAAQAHDGQVRKAVAHMPYIMHPYNVGMILMRMGMPEHVVISGILHDTVEDTAITIEQIQKIFGAEVASLVAAVTDPPGANFQERTEYHLKQIRETNNEVRAIKAADVLHNLFCKVQSIRTDGEYPWHLHDNTREENFDGIKRRLEEFRKFWNHPILNEIETYLNEIVEYYAKAN